MKGNYILHKKCSKYANKTFFGLFQKKVVTVDASIYRLLGDFKQCKELFNSAYFMVCFYIVLTFAVDNQ